MRRRVYAESPASHSEERVDARYKITGHAFRCPFCTSNCVSIAEATLCRPVHYSIPLNAIEVALGVHHGVIPTSISVFRIATSITVTSVRATLMPFHLDLSLQATMKQIHDSDQAREVRLFEFLDSSADLQKLRPPYLTLPTIINVPNYKIAIRARPRRPAAKVV